MKQATTQFEFTAKPKVTALKPKYRERDEDAMEGTNLMNDPRIIRGNTYAAIIANKNQVQPPPPVKKTNANDKPKPKQQKRRINFDTGFEPSTPRAINGREHFTTQTEPFVETLRDKSIQYEKECQTDLYLDRPIEREFNAMAQKTGVQKTTQVDENDPELFNFDYEVQPILQALLNQVLEVSRMELYEEDSMREKQHEKYQFEKRRHILLAEAQQLEANENRHSDEYERRHLQYRKAKQQEGFAGRRVISRILSKQYLKNLQENTQLVLEHNGFFRSPLQLDLLQQFEPWLYSQVLGCIQAQKEYEDETAKMIQQSQKDAVAASQISINQERLRKQRIVQERNDKLEERRIRKEAKRIAKEEERQRQLEEEAAAQAAKQEEESAPPPT